MSADKNAIQARLRRYWPRVRLFSFLLLAAWFLATFFTVYYARELSDFDFFGWPVSFYLAAQGLVLFYLAVTGLYVKYMQRLDRLLEDGNDDGK